MALWACKCNVVFEYVCSAARCVSQMTHVNERERRRPRGLAHDSGSSSTSTALMPRFGTPRLGSGALWVALIDARGIAPSLDLTLGGGGAVVGASESVQVPHFPSSQSIERSGNACSKALQASSAAPDCSVQAVGSAPCSRATRGSCFLPTLLSAPGSARRRMATPARCQPQRWHWRA